MAKTPATPPAPAADGPDYEPFIDILTEKLDAWKASDEPTHEFARRAVGLMRTHQKKWEDKRRP